MRKLMVVTILALAAAVPLQAQTAPRTTFGLQAGSKLWIEGTSSVRSYRCEAGTVRGEIAADGANLALERIREVRSGSLNLDVAALDCANGTMNGHMRNALKAQAHPRIEFRFRSVQLQGGEAQVQGDLFIAGETRPVTLPGTIVQEADGALRLAGSLEIRMTEWKVQPPSLMLGTMKVHDPVRVHYDVLFR
jgi:polyisoprenoid-binding protein YceI